MDYLKIQNQKIAYVDQGHQETIVIVHGTPTNSDEYSEVIRQLSKSFRCVALDHLGFGSSDKPQDGDYSIESHRQRLITLLKHLNIRSFHILAHDFGGVIALPLVLDKDFEVKSVSILNSWLWPLIETEPQMKNQQWLVSSGVFPFLYRHFNFSAKFLIKMGWGQHKPLTADRHHLYTSRFPNSSTREGTVAFLKTLFDFENKCWEQSPVLTELNKKPVQLIWGQADKLISSRNLERWKKELQNAETLELPEVGHFVAEEAPQIVATKLEHFINSLS